MVILSILIYEAITDIYVIVQAPFLPIYEKNALQVHLETACAKFMYI